MVAEDSALIAPVGAAGNDEQRRSFVYRVDDFGNVFINGVKHNELFSDTAISTVADRVLMGPSSVMLGRTVRYTYKPEDDRHGE
jgi:hypothetical protein